MNCRDTSRQVNRLAAWKFFASSFVLLMVLAAFLLLPCEAQSPPAGPLLADPVPGEYYAIYDAILGNVKLPKKEALGGIYSKTLNLKCGEESGNPVLVNGCGGFFMPPDGIEEVHTMLRQSFVPFSPSTWDHFQATNQLSATLTDGFHTNWKHKLVGQSSPDEGSKGAQEDCLFFFSQPGVSSDGREAIVFVLMFSYIKHVPSTADYFLLRGGDSRGWRIRDRLQYYRTGGSNETSSSSSDNTGSNK